MSDAQGDGWAECSNTRGVPRRDGTGSAAADHGLEPSEFPFLPRVSALTATRPRLRRRLGRQAALTIVEAPPGFGKTTLAVSWAQELATAGHRVIWVTATEDPDDQSAVRDLVVDGLALGGPAAQPVMMIVDDAHLWRDSSIADSLVQLVRRARHVHLLVLADTDHHFGLAAARHGQEANRLRAADLEILPDEMSAFAAAWGHDLGTDDAQRLHTMVGGWPLPLRLVLDATPSGTPEFATSSAHDFVTSRVLPLITNVVDVSTASRLAVPSRLDIELVGAIVQGSVHDADARNVADALVTTLERHGLLRGVARRDGVAQWAFLPPLRGTLLDRLERTEPETARLVNRLVARALSARGGETPFDEVLRHARSGEDWSLLAGLWSQHGWPLIATEEAAFQHAYRAVPAAVHAEHPPLEFASCLADALAGTMDLDPVRRTEVVLHHYTRTGTSLLSRRQPTSSPQHAAEMLAAAMMARRSDGDLVQARNLASEAGRELARAWMAEPGRRLSSQVAWFHLQSAITHYMSTDVTAAVEHATAAHRFGPHTLLGVAASGLLSVFHTIEGNTADGRHWLAVHESVALTGTWAPLVALPARLARAMLALDRLDREAAEAELVEVPLGQESCGLWPLVVLAHQRHALIFGDPVSALSRLERVRRARAAELRDERSAARRIMDRCTVDLWLALSEVNRAETRLKETAAIPSWLLAPASRLYLMSGNPDTALRISAAAVWREDVDVRDRTELLVAGAQASRELGDTAQAHEMFRRAHLLSTDTGNAQPFLLMPVDVRRELLEATGLRLDTAMLADLDMMRPPYPERADLVRLSPREREVLRQSADHGTAADIARTLTVSVNTVKKQLASLYLKLGVSDRASALLRAEALGLLDAPRGTDPPE